MPGGGKTYERVMASCIRCHNTISVNNLGRHFKSKECLRGFKFGISHATIALTEDLSCTFCQKVCKSENSYRQHIIRCSKNPNKISIHNVGNHTKSRIPWNKGQTKATNSILKLAGEKLKQKYDSGEITSRSPASTKEFWTFEKRKEKSEWRKKLHRENPETHPNRRLAGNRNKMSYPEKVAYDFLKKNQIIFEHNKQVDKFFPDFIIGNLIIEIDGKQWHDPEYDRLRDEILMGYGYSIYRIDSRDNIEKRITEILALG